MYILVPILNKVLTKIQNNIVNRPLFCLKVYKRTSPENYSINVSKKYFIKMQVESKYSETLSKQFNTSTDVIIPTFDKCIENIAKKEGYINYVINKKDLSPDGGNFLGNLSEIDIKGNTENGYKETAIFCKRLTPNPVDMGFMSLTNVYQRELFAYKQLAKVINDLQDEANIPVDERFNTVKCYDESSENIIFLDNLSRKGFKTCHRMDIVSLEMAEISIKQMARFHGVSFAIERRRPEYFINNIKNIKTPFIAGKELNDFVEKSTNVALDLLDDVKCSVKDKIKKIMAKFPYYHQDYSNACCLCHADFRPNNIMVREMDGVTVEAVPVDFQLIFYSWPLMDFFYFMYMATDYAFRKAHMTYLKDLYYKSLDTYLQHYDISVEEVLPRRTFEKLYEEKIDYGLITTFISVQFLYVIDDGEVPDVSKENIIDIDFKFDDKFNHRLAETVQEFIDMGYL